jgi:hypothetical protein
MYHSMNGWSWLWMSFVGIFWAVFLGSVVYLAVRLAQQHHRRP